jgi:2-polyprenyl-3-methyl-5-hydroxy-6-metoxy-1,4-benzoquinol methylase
MTKNPSGYYQDKNVVASYDKARFSSFAGKTFAIIEKRNIRKAFSGVARGSTIIDVPCGTGRLAEVLLEEGFQVVGMDISQAMLEYAQHRLARFGDRFTVQTVDMMKPDFSPHGHYDAALCARVLMHFPVHKQIIFLQNVASLVRGPIVFTQSWTSPYQRFRRSLKRLLRHQTAVRYPLSGASLKQLLEGAGVRERRRLRPCPPLTEEIIVVAELDTKHESGLERRTGSHSSPRPSG